MFFSTICPSSEQENQTFNSPQSAPQALPLLEYSFPSVTAMAQNISEHVAERIVVDHNLPNSAHRNLRDVADATVLVGQFREVFEGVIRTELITNIEL